MLTSTRRRLAAGAMVLLVPTLGACGFGYQTDKVYQPAEGVNDRSGTVDVLGAVVVATREGQGTLIASLVDTDQSKEDALVSVTGSGIQGEVTAPVKVPADSLVNLAQTGAVSIAGTGITPGKFARLTLTFESGQTTKINVPVVPFDDIYSNITPANPSASPTS